MNKTSLFLNIIFIASNISACLDRFMQENPNISITSDCKPNLIERQNFIKYCLGQNYVSEKTVKSLANLSENKSYTEIDNAVSTAIKNYKNQKSKYRKLMDSINPLSNSSIEKHLFQVFKPETNSVKAFLKNHTPEIVLTSVIVTAVSLLGLKYFNKKSNMQPISHPDNKIIINPNEVLEDSVSTSRRCNKEDMKDSDKEREKRAKETRQRNQKIARDRKFQESQKNK